jgi:type IV pilus assembly protein PilX
MFNQQAINQQKMIKNYPLVKQQKGMVLFIALIALVAMSLAAAALVRSVDSGVLVAGNLAFKQSAIMSAETGIARAYTYINSKASAVPLQASEIAQGYYSVFDDGLIFNDPDTWRADRTMYVDDDIRDLSGNETRYILQRMCRAPTEVNAANCLVGVGKKAPGSQGTRNEGGGAGGGGYCTDCKGESDAVAYRLTVRVKGPKNTFSYLQAFIY